MIKRYILTPLLALLLISFFAAHAQTGNVGIGTTQPTQRLDVEGNARVRGLSGTGTRLPVVMPDGTLGVNAPVYSTTAAPVGAFPTAAIGSVVTDGRPYGIAVSGTTVYVISNSSTLQLFDVSTPTNPVLVGSVATDSTPVSVAVSGTTAYVVSSSNTLQTFDVSTPANPVLLATVATNTRPLCVAVGGTTAYVVNNSSNTLQIFNVSTPSNPLLVSTISTDARPRSVAVSGTTAYVLNQTSRSLQTFDVSTPASPVRLGRATTNSSPWNMAVSGTKAYVVTSVGNALQAFDVSTPTSLVQLTSVGTDSSPFGVAASGITAYVVNYSSNTLQAFNLSNPASPFLVGSVATDSYPNNLVVSGNIAYVSTNNSLQVFSFPSFPRALVANSDGSLASVTLPGPQDFIQNQTALQSRANFNIDGSGYVGGNVGIGTTTPAEKLEIKNGNLQLTSTGPASVGIGNGTGSLNLGLAANPGEYSSASQAGDAVLRTNGQRLLLAGRNGGEVLVATGTGGTETERLRVTSAGNVGVGTSSPQARLHVAGDVRIDGLTGTGTRMLTTDANGTVGSQPLPSTSTPQQLSLSGSTLSLTNGGTVTLPASTDAQQLSLSGSTLILTNGGSVNLPAEAPQQLSLNGSTLSLTNGGTVTLPASTDAQQLSLNGSTLSLTNGGTVTLPVSNDNLGNHTATQNLNLAAYQLVGNGGSTGLAISTTGSVGIGTTTPAASAALDVTSTTKGFLPPRLTQVQRDAIASPAAGLTVYNTFTNKLNTWDGTRWTEPLNAAEMSVSPGGTQTFTYTGAVQTYTVPPGVTQLLINALGATGGSRGGAGGNGGRVEATITVTPGEMLQVHVGGAGFKAGTGSSGGGGWNGGGPAYDSGYGSGGGGGGATDIRRAADNLTDRLLVAAGGGGGAYIDGPNSGGSGGYPTGTAGDNGIYGANSGGGGATQTGPGAGGSPRGSLGQGGGAARSLAGGGGGGYYGGGGGTNGAGGGGSSWALPGGTTSVTYTNAVGTGNGSLTIIPVRALLTPALSSANITAPVEATGSSGGVVFADSSGLNQNPKQLYWNNNTNQLTVATGTLGVGTASPAASAALDVTSTSKGLLPPRLSSAQRDAIASPAVGLLIFNTYTGKLNVWNGLNWTEPLSSSDDRVLSLQTQTFAYTGAVQTYTVPAGITSLQVTAGGAQGGGGLGNTEPGGSGATAQVQLAVTPGEVLQLYVGGQGGQGPGTSSGGWNGGGGGFGYGGSGGGATDIRRGGTALTNRVLVAGGGGGGGYGAGRPSGGGGGTPNGGTGYGTAGYGIGATQTAGGSANGTLGLGGDGVSSNGVRAGGGGGYYGGGGAYNGSGGGGSSWANPATVSNLVYLNANSGNGYLTITPVRTQPAPTLDGTNISGTWSVTGSSYYYNNGNVGIGTSRPNQPLTVQAGATSNSPLLGFYSQAGADKFNFSLAGGGLNLSESNVAGGRLFVQPGGNVGIGTTTPSQTLDVNGGILARGTNAISNQGAYLQWNRSGGGDGATWLINQQGLGPGGIVLGKSDQSNNVTEWGRFDGNGNLGIGTTSPIAKLHVSGSAAATPSGSGTSYFSATTALQGPGIPNGSGARATAAYFDGGQVWVNSVIVAGALNTTSDRRIKHVIGLSDRAADLALLNKLRITDYSYIDQVNNTPGLIKKVIAQEVEEVLPTAVSRSRQALPNVYEKATKLSYASGQLTVTTAKPHELPASGGRMRFYTPSNESVDVDVTVVDAHTVRFASAEAHASGLFVYGKYVDDFRSVDYDALTTLNVSATQALARKVEALEQQNAALKANADAIKNELQTVRAQATADKAQATAAFETFEARLRRLEANNGGQAQR